MTKKAVAVAVSLATVGIFFWTPLWMENFKNAGSQMLEFNVSSILSPVQLMFEGAIELSSPEELQLEAWSTFEQYIGYAQDNNLEGVKSLTYKLGSVCSNPEKREECNSLMSGVAFIAKSMKQEDFKNVWADQRQVIIHTNYRKIENEDVVSYVRAIIYYVRTKEGLKILAFNNADGIFILKRDLSPEALNERLERSIKDSDMDGMSDEVERETDPNDRDSNNNGWWDSTEFFLNLR